MNTINVFCIIVTYNAMKWVDRCISSLRQSTIQITPVIIDNCSKDNTIDYIKKTYPEAHIIINNVNKGFGQANNQGIEWAYSQGATHFFLLNQDAWIEPNAISNIIKIQEANNISVAVPVHLNGKGNAVDFGYYNNSFMRLGASSCIADLLLSKLKEYYPLPFLNAAGWVINRKTIEEIGGFDPLFFHYGEDRNYTQRLMYHKKVLAMVPSAIMYHDRDQHGNEKVYNQKRVISTLLREFADINHPYTITSRKSMKLILWLFKDVLKNMICMRFSTAFDMLEGFVDCFKKNRQIEESRKQNIKVGANWLNLE